MKEVSEPLMEHEEKVLFEAIGDYGPWQRNAFISIFVVNIFVTWQNMAVTFLAPNQGFRCSSINHYHLNETSPSSLIVNNVSYKTTNECEFTMRDYSAVNHSHSPTMKCTHWEYNISKYPHTIINEWDLVCEREWFISLAKSIYMAGFMASTIISGPFSDSFGRFPTIMICWIILCTSGILSAFSTSYCMFIILRFFMAFGGCGLGTTGYIHMMEITGPRRRTEIGILIQLSGVIGMVLFSAVTWKIKHWVYLELVMSVPTLGFACSYWIMSESPRWLMAHQKGKKFKAVLTKVIRINSRTFPDDIENILSFSSITKRKYDVKTMTFLDLVRTPEMRKRVLNLAALWVVNAFVYYALTYNTNDLGGDPNLTFFLSGAVEFPGFIFMLVAAKKSGRRTSILGGMAIAALFCILIIPLSQDVNWLIISFAMVAKLFISVTFGLLYLYTAEIFPTVIRNMAFGTCSAFARIGSISAPFARELGKVSYSWVPNALNGGLALSAGLLVLFLPETKDKKIPDTLEELECFMDDAHEKEYQVMEDFVNGVRTSKKTKKDGNHIYTRIG